MSKRNNTFTRFIEEIVDDDEDDSASASLHTLESAVAELTAKVNQLAEVQLAAGSTPAPKRATSSSAAG